MFYPEDKEQLQNEIKLLLDLYKPEKKYDKVFGIVAPHAGYVYSGKTAAYGYNTIAGKDYKTVVVISPSHREYFPGISIYSGDAYEIPLGIAIALTMPRKGPWVSVCLVLMALPLLIPWNVVGAMWNIFALPKIGFMGHVLNSMGFDFNFTRQPGDAWFTLILMDVWHWTSLIVLLCYAGLSSIPDDYYQAANIDGARRWAIFRYIQLPKMKRVLTIAVLLRFMDSFMIYTEPFVLTGGGPGNTTTFLSIDLVKIALGQFDLGPAAAMSLIYFLVVLLICWVFYTIMMRNEEQ